MKKSQRFAPPNPYTEKLLLYLSKTQRAKIVEHAQFYGVTLTSVVRDAIDEKFEISTHANARMNPEAEP